MRTKLLIHCLPLAPIMVMVMTMAMAMAPNLDTSIRRYERPSWCLSPGMSYEVNGKYSGDKMVGRSSNPGEQNALAPQPSSGEQNRRRKFGGEER